MKKNYKQLSRYGLLAFAIFISFLPILNPLQIFSSLQNYSFDTFQRILPREVHPEDPVVIIDIDDRSLAEIGQWPWSRNQLASLTNQAYAAAALGFDIVFAEGSVLNYRDTLGANADFQRIFNSSLRSNGILKAPMKFYASLAHNNADLEATEYAIERAIEACAHYY